MRKTKKVENDEVSEKIGLKNSFLEKLEVLLEDSPKFKTRTKKSLEWYKQKVTELYGNRGVRPSTVLDNPEKKLLPRAGDIILFHYRPKYKKILPYYDMYPMTLILKVIPGGFLGLNFHYLYPKDRLLFMSGLYRHQKYIEALDKVSINIRYSTLANTTNNKLMYYKPCLKKYLTKNIGNFIYQIPHQEWDVVLFLPTERFVKEKKEEVWRQSSLMARGKKWG